MSEIEINLLLDRLEALLVESRPFLFSSGVIIDRERCFDIINQMRISIPEEVKKAQRLQSEHDRIIAQANEESNRIIELSHQQAQELVGEHEVVRQAEEKAQFIVERSQNEAQQIRFGADDYARQVLEQMEADLLKQLSTVQNGLSALASAESVPEPEAAD